MDPAELMDDDETGFGVLQDIDDAVTGMD